MPPIDEQSWTLRDAARAMGTWVQRENPPPDQVIAVKRWLANRTFDPFEGLQREEPDTWRGRVPGTVLAGTCRVDPEQRSILIDTIGTEPAP